MLVESTGRVVPNLGRLPFEWACAERLDDPAERVSSDEPGPDAAVVAEAIVEVGELRFHDGAPLVERFRSVKSPVDVVAPAGDDLHACGLATDLVGQRFDSSVGVADLDFVASTVEGAVVFGDGVQGRL